VDLVTVKVLYKAFFFMVRAFQDRIYEVLFDLQTGNRAGDGIGMKEALKKPANPVGALLRERAELDYFGWFGPFRDKRNELKDGVRASWGSSGGAFGIVLGRRDEPETIYTGPVLGENDVLEAIRQTTATLRVIRDVAASASRG
jgi:hypothetical protein